MTNINLPSRKCHLSLRFLKDNPPLYSCRLPPLLFFRFLWHYMLENHKVSRFYVFPCGWKIQSQMYPHVKFYFFKVKNIMVALRINSHFFINTRITFAAENNWLEYDAGLMLRFVQSWCFMMNELSKILLLHSVVMTIRFIHKFTRYIMLGDSKDAQFVSFLAMEEAWFESRAFKRAHIVFTLLFTFSNPRSMKNLCAYSRWNRLLQLPDPVEILLEIYDFIWLYATMCVSIVDSDWSVLGFHINDFIRLYTLLNDYLEFLNLKYTLICVHIRL